MIRAVTAGIPHGQEAAAMPLERLAMRLLAYLRSEEERGGFISRHNLVGTAVLHGYAEGDVEDYMRLIQEAWDWLYTHGLISRGHPAQSGAEWAFVTRAGRTLLEQRDEPA
jgi:hypothetical protein